MPYLANLSSTGADLVKHPGPIRRDLTVPEFVGVGHGCQLVRQPNLRLWVEVLCLTTKLASAQIFSDAHGRRASGRLLTKS